MLPFGIICHGQNKVKGGSRGDHCCSRDLSTGRPWENSSAKAQQEHSAPASSRALESRLKRARILMLHLPGVNTSLGLQLRGGQFPCIHAELSHLAFPWMRSPSPPASDLTQASQLHHSQHFFSFQHSCSLPYTSPLHDHLFSLPNVIVFQMLLDTHQLFPPPVI